MHENTGWALPKGSLNTKITTGCSQIELAMKSTRSTWPRNKIMLGPTKRITELPGKLEQHCGSPNPWHTNHFQQWNSTMQHVRTRSRSWSRSSRSTSTKNTFFYDWSQTWKINKFSKESQELIADMNNNAEILELGENSSKKQCPECNTYWRSWIIHCSSGRNMKSSQSPINLPAEQVRRHFDPWLRHQEEQQSRCQTRTFWTAQNVLPGETNVEKGPSEKARTPPNDNCTMVRRQRLHKFVVSHRVEGKRHKASDRIAFDKHHYTATQDERIQNSKHWILTLNTEGPQQPLFQRPDFVQA